MGDRDPLSTMASWFAPDGQQHSGRGMLQKIQEQPVSFTHDPRDRSQPLPVGVGMMFQVHPDRSLRVAQIERNCSAARSGVIQMDDEVLKIDGRDVEKQPITVLKDTVPGRQGTYVTLTFRRMTAQGLYVYEVELMRGAAEFIELVAQCKSMAREQAKMVRRLRELEDVVKAHEAEMGGMVDKVLTSEETAKRARALHLGSEDALSRAQVEIAALRKGEEGIKGLHEEAERRMVMSCEKQLSAVAAEKEALQTKLNEEQNSRLDLERELLGLQTRLQEALNADADKSSQLQRQEGKLAGLDRLIEKLHDEAAQREAALERETARCVDMQQRVAALEKEQRQASVAGARRESELKTCQDELASVRKGSEVARSQQLEDLREERLALKAENAELRGRSEALGGVEAEREVLARRVEGLELELARARGERATTVETMETAIAQRQQELSQLKADHLVAKRALEEARSSIQTLEAQLQERKKEVERGRETARGMEESLRVIEERRRTEREEHVRRGEEAARERERVLGERSAAANEQVQRLMQAVRAEKERIAALESDKAALASEVEGLQQRLSEAMASAVQERETLERAMKESIEAERLRRNSIEQQMVKQQAAFDMQRQLQVQKQEQEHLQQQLNNNLNIHQQLHQRATTSTSPVLSPMSPNATFQTALSPEVAANTTLDGTLPGHPLSPQVAATAPQSQSLALGATATQAVLVSATHQLSANAGVPASDPRADNKPQHSLQRPPRPTSVDNQLSDNGLKHRPPTTSMVRPAYITNGARPPTPPPSRHLPTQQAAPGTAPAKRRGWGASEGAQEEEWRYKRETGSDIQPAVAPQVSTLKKMFESGGNSGPPSSPSSPRASNKFSLQLNTKHTPNDSNLHTSATVSPTFTEDHSLAATPRELLSLVASPDVESRVGILAPSMPQEQHANGALEPLFPNANDEGLQSTGMGHGTDETDPLESYVRKGGFVIAEPVDPLDRPLPAAAQLLSRAPSHRSIVAKASSRGRTVRFEEANNLVLTFQRSVSEFSSGPQGQAAVGMGGPATWWEAALDAEEVLDGADRAREEEVRENTAINAGSAFTFC